MKSTSRIEVVIKVGGALLRDPAAFSRTARDLATLAGAARALIVPGGGPFADIVRDLDRRLPVPEEGAHWMATLAMDQYAHMLVAHVQGAALVEDASGAVNAIETARLPVLAPYRWLRHDDPLPHSWDVTSDSIAAWIAGAVGAPHLVLVKPVAGPIAQYTDPYFARALTLIAPPAPKVHICTSNSVLPLIAALPKRRPPA